MSNMFYPDKTNRKLHLGLIAFLTNFAIEAALIFIPLLSKELGASNLSVGIVGAGYGMAYFASSLFFGWESDRKGRVRFVQVGLGLSVIAFLLHLLANNLAVLMLVRGIAGFSLGISSAALLAYVYETEGNVGKFSSYGSLGWVFGALAAAIIKAYKPLFLLSSILCIMAFLLTLRLRKEKERQRSITPQLLRVVRRNIKVYSAFFLRHLGASALWIVLPLLLAQIGADKLWIGTLSVINFGGQFLAMRYVDRFKETKLFLIGLVLSGAVFLAYFLASDYRQLIPVQVVLSLAWSCLYIGVLLLLLRGGEERGTTTGVLYSTINLCNAAGPFLGGALSQLWGFQFVALFAAALSFSGIPLALRLRPSPVLVSSATGNGNPRPEE